MREISNSGERWARCKDYPAYYVSTQGRVYTTHRHRIKSQYDCRGYLKVDLRKGGVKHKVRVNRLVAIAFCYRAEGQDFVHHSNDNSQDNNANNLVWCTKVQHILFHRALRNRKRKEGKEL